jgi:hypothetical protein
MFMDENSFNNKYATFYNPNPSRFVLIFFSNSFFKIYASNQFFPITCFMLFIIKFEVYLPEITR